MNPDTVFERIGKIPYMRRDQGWIFYEFIVSNALQVGLELGFFQGASTAYIAGALQDLGTGSLITIDRTNAKAREPNIEETLEKSGLSHLVTVYYEPRSFNWRLMKLLEEGRYETFDFCYIDGGHNWYETGFAFCIVERLLKPGGWVIFDDLYYSERECGHGERAWAQRLPEEERIVRQVERVFTLLVEANPYFGSFRRLGRFAFARKKCAVWSREERAENTEEILLSRVLEKARSDPEFRVALLRDPARILAEYSGQQQKDYEHLRFVDTDSAAPAASETRSSGETLVYLERPAWGSDISEAALQKMLDE